jgi:formylglycine-generating enzyme required for sulfatase activity
MRNPPWLLLLPVLLTACTTAGRQHGPDVFENSLGMKFVLLPAGEFLMGSDETPASLARDFAGYDMARFLKLDDEAPVHRVRISQPFWLGQHEVTVGQFRQFLAASGYVPESIADGSGAYAYNPNYDPATTVRRDAFEGRDPKYSWMNPGFQQSNEQPVVNVTWHDAQALARWLSDKEKKHYRLPTEAEWEYACRAGSRTRYAHGDEPSGLAGAANTFDAEAAGYWPRWQGFALAGSDGFAFTAPVGSFPANAFGVHDMVGNVWEWVADWHDEHWYARSPATDPQGPESGTVKVRRGGSWHTWSLYARCAFRNWNTPQTRYTLVGIRLLLEAGAE